MVIDVVMPKMGESITEGTILEWYKKVGEPIAQDETLLEIGTDKVDSEIPAPNGGIVIEILAQPNDVIDVGEVIARIETSIAETDNEQSIGESDEPVKSNKKKKQVEKEDSSDFASQSEKINPIKITKLNCCFGSVNTHSNKHNDLLEKILPYNYNITNKVDIPFYRGDQRYGIISVISIEKIQ